MKRDYYRLSVEEVLRRLGVDAHRGLGDDEVRARQVRDGYNEFEKAKHNTLWQKFISQFKSFMIIVLLVAAAISGVTGYVNGEGVGDALIILVILVVNAIIGVLQEAKAEKSLDALERLSAPHCKVVRGGEHRVIATRQLVVGDIVELETGDSVPADIRLTEAVNLKIQEAALTGESEPVQKGVDVVEGEVPIGDRVNMAYSSCSVTYGRGRGVVVATGADTEVGKIASMLQSVEDMRTPMQVRLDRLGRVLAVISLVACGVIFVVGLCYGRGVMEMFMVAVSLAVAAIPEGLPAVSTVVLALGVQRLVRQRAIVRNLPSVETLGSTTVICSDKTGTLTQNKMTVVEEYPAQSEWARRIGVLCNDTKRGDSGELLGDPTEAALVAHAMAGGCDMSLIAREYRRVAEVPFDSERKLMTTVHSLQEERVLVATKGGFDELLARCSRILDGGAVRELREEDRVRLEGENVSMAERALRVLGMAYKEVEFVDGNIEKVVAEVEQELIFVGMVGMIDPPREEARIAVAQCKLAGIKPVMITGDHRATAMAIAERLAIVAEADRVMTGAEVEQMTDDELSEAVGTTSVFARVAPEHKVRIVKAFQARGNVVAMTGDGVNDAPALKLADIGVAMGVTGTDVAKEAADVVLADDNFATIVHAVREGRRIYDNLMKSIQFMISTNMGEIVLLLVAVLYNFELPLLPIQLLFINLVCDSLPSLALSVDPAGKDIMRRQPIDPRQGMFTREFVAKVSFQALIIGGVSIATYLLGVRESVAEARTMTFAVMIFSQFAMIFSIRSGKNWFTYRFFSNGWLWMTIGLVVVLTLVVMHVSSMQEMFGLVGLTSAQWWIVAAMSVGVLVLSEVGKICTKR